MPQIFGPKAERAAQPQSCKSFTARHSLRRTSGGEAVQTGFLCKANHHYKWRKAMPKYVIERVVPGASKMTPAELKTLSQRSCSVLNQLGPQIQWVHSYVTDNKIYCVYVAPNEELVREHARLGGFPANHVAQVKTMIDPTTSEE